MTSFMAFLGTLWIYIKPVLAGVGFTGGGIGLIKFLKHMPAPYENWLWVGAVFDTLEDLISNNERIGERRTKDRGLILLPLPTPRQETANEELELKNQGNALLKK